MENKFSLTFGEKADNFDNYNTETNPKLIIWNFLINNFRIYKSVHTNNI